MGDEWAQESLEGKTDTVRIIGYRPLSSAWSCRVISAFLDSGRFNHYFRTCFFKVVRTKIASEIQDKVIKQAEMAKSAAECHQNSSDKVRNRHATN